MIKVSGRGISCLIILLYIPATVFISYPLLSISCAVFEVSEDVPSAVPFGNVYATDRDGIGAITYTTSSPLFQISPVSGAVARRFGANLDFENQ